jgi:hypothetical protein
MGKVAIKESFIKQCKLFNRGSFYFTDSTSKLERACPQKLIETGSFYKCCYKGLVTSIDLITSKHAPRV